MTARILDYRHWRAAQERRACRERAIIRSLYAGPIQPKRLTLDQILGPTFDPSGGAA
ncbi:hypothetical protein [Sphingobium cupriresistens]|uniref:hypothetical protein n=1 Tax=Sphingobium cupriresistens TaxID=1132417 RepID=UPI0013ED7DC9|nr:hypothetical protein [Sphingobium cupriresistens]